MQRDGMDRLVDRWLNEPSFRQAMLADPEAAVQRSGISLDEEEWATVRNVVMTLGDEELRDRVSKGLWQT